MIVTTDSFSGVIPLLERESFLGLDTETSGLTENDRLFSIILATEKDTFYFNYLEYDNIPANFVLPRNYIQRLASILEDPGKTFFISKAKFDLRILSYESLQIRGRVHCILAAERVVYNAHPKGFYNLDSLSRHYGFTPKSDEVKKYLDKHKLYIDQVIPGKKQKHRVYYFHKCPFDIVSKYAEHDARLHYDIGMAQIKWVKEYECHPRSPNHSFVLENEIKLTKTCFKMERTGIRINREYTRKALDFENERIEQVTRDFHEATGIMFQDGRTTLVKAFEKLGEPYPRTEKGNPSFTEEVLEGMTTPVASMVNRIRKHQKRAGTYYSSFLHYAGDDDIIHPDMLQEGTETGRFSYQNPNLQNVPKEDEEEDKGKPFYVRGCFQPRPDFCFVPIDFDQQEYRLMLDYAGEKTMIDAVNSGLDLHQATADLVGVTRKQAKTLNFAILYGAGDEKLAWMLGIGRHEAMVLRQKYFGKLPMVQKFIMGVRQTGKERGYIWNWAGRRLHITSPEFAYVLPNHIIQGGSADVCKIAMSQIQDLLERKNARSRMCVQIHDEILSEIHKDEFDLIPEIKAIMESVYKPRNGLALTASVSHSWKSWAYFDMVKGMP